MGTLLLYDGLDWKHGGTQSRLIWAGAGTEVEGKAAEAEIWRLLEDLGRVEENLRQCVGVELPAFVRSEYMPQGGPLLLKELFVRTA